MLILSPPESFNKTPPTREKKRKIKHLTAFHPSRSKTPKCGRALAIFDFVPQSKSNGNIFHRDFVIASFEKDSAYEIKKSDCVPNNSPLRSSIMI